MVTKSNLVVKKDLNISVIVTYTYPYIGSGIGNVALKQAERLAQLGHNVTIISSNFPKGVTDFVYNSVRHLKMPATDFLERYNVPIPLFTFNSKARKAIRKSDVVHIHDSVYPSSLLASIYSKIYRKRTILTQHVSFVKYPSAILNLIQKVAYGIVGNLTFLLCDKIVYFNPVVKELISGFNKSIEIPNGVDTQLFSPANTDEKTKYRKEFGLPLDKKIVLFVGRLVPKKGFRILYKANSKEYLTVFVGPGTPPEEFLKNENVRFFPALPQDQLSKFYKLSDIFILPSYGEGFPLSLQEAMSSGLPSITSKENIFDDRLSFIKTVNINPKSIKETITKLINSESELKTMSKQSRDFVEKYYTWDKNVNDLLNLYTNKI